MTKQDRAKANAFLKWLRKEWPNKCRNYCFGCHQCAAIRAIEEIESLIQDFMMEDSEIKEMEVKWKKRIGE